MNLFVGKNAYRLFEASYFFNPNSLTFIKTKTTIKNNHVSMFNQMFDLFSPIKSIVFNANGSNNI